MAAENSRNGHNGRALSKFRLRLRPPRPPGIIDRVPGPDRAGPGPGPELNPPGKSQPKPGPDRAGTEVDNTGGASERAGLSRYLLTVWQVDDPESVLDRYGIEAVRVAVDKVRQSMGHRAPEAGEFGSPSGLMVRRIQRAAQALRASPGGSTESSRDRYVEEYRRIRGHLPWENPPP